MTADNPTRVSGAAQQVAARAPAPDIWDDPYWLSEMGEAESAVVAAAEAFVAAAAALASAVTKVGALRAAREPKP